jgi:hypothetical protein
MTDALDPEPLLRALHEADVRHIIIGGFAVNAHGVIRPSRDLDIVPAPDAANLRRLASLLAEIDARHVGIGELRPDEFPFDPTRVDDLRAGANFRLETRLGDLDVMQWVAGIDEDPAYDALASEAIEGELDTREVPRSACAARRAGGGAAVRGLDAGRDVSAVSSATTTEARLFLAKAVALALDAESATDPGPLGVPEPGGTRPEGPAAPIPAQSPAGSLRPPAARG